MLIQEAYPGKEREKAFVPLGVEKPRTLSDADIEQFNAQGYICPLDVYSPAESRALTKFFDGLLQKTAAKGYNSYGILDWHANSPEVHDLVTETRILDYLEDLLGPDLLCWGTHFFAKLPGDGKRVSFHQDASFWALTPSKTVTVWLAIDDADAENAAMQVVPGTHLMGQLPFQYSEQEEENVLDQTTLPLSDLPDPVHLEMRAGQISLHTDWLLHGSDPNESDRRRCGLTLRFTSPDVRNFFENGGSGVMARGHDPAGYWQHVPRPQAEHIPPAPRPEDNWQEKSGWKKHYDSKQ